MSHPAIYWGFRDTLSEKATQNRILVALSRNTKASNITTDNTTRLFLEPIFKVSHHLCGSIGLLSCRPIAISSGTTESLDLSFPIRTCPAEATLHLRPRCRQSPSTHTAPSTRPKQTASPPRRQTQATTVPLEPLTLPLPPPPPLRALLLPTHLPSRARSPRRQLPQPPSPPSSSSSSSSSRPSAQHQPSRSGPRVPLPLNPAPSPSRREHPPLAHHQLGSPRLGSPRRPRPGRHQR